MVLFVAVVVVGSVLLNLARGDHFTHAVSGAGIAVALGVVVGVAYYLFRRFVRPL
jgi:hypothetical protein